MPAAGVKYRYYLSSALLNGAAQRAGSVARGPAAEVEAVVVKSVREHFRSQRAIDDRTLIETHVVRTEVHTDHLIVKLVQAEAEDDHTRPETVLSVPWQKTASTRRREILIPEGTSPQQVRRIRSENRATLVTSIARYETMTTARGYRYATSVHGTLTGRGADLIVLDDPQKPDEALSEAHRKSVGDWFDTTLLTRLDSKSTGAVVLVMQRVHEDDLAGRLLEKGGWHHLKVAAIAEMDEQIPIGRHRTYKRKAGDVIDPNGDSLEALMAMKQSMGELFISAQYQQEPIPLAGRASRQMVNSMSEQQLVEFARTKRKGLPRKKTG
jgi:Protein of unknwon function (DUF3008)